MTEKRFNYHIDEVGVYYYICDNTKKGDDRIILELNTKYDALEVCDVLNSLNDEIEKLKEDLAYAERCRDGIGRDFENYRKMHNTNWW